MSAVCESPSVPHHAKSDHEGCQRLIEALGGTVVSLALLFIVGRRSLASYGRDKSIDLSAMVEMHAAAVSALSTAHGIHLDRVHEAIRVLDHAVLARDFGEPWPETFEKLRVMVG